MVTKQTMAGVLYALVFTGAWPTLMAGQAHSAEVFTTTTSTMRVNSMRLHVDTGNANRLHDFGATGGFIDPATGVSRLATIISGAGYAKNVLLNGKTITNAGVPGRVEWKPEGVITASLPWEGQVGEPCRAQAASYQVATDIPLIWNLGFQFGGAAAGQDWRFLPHGVDPALIWQVKAPGRQPSLAMIVDTDDADASRLMLYFSERTGSATKVQRAGTVHGLPAGVPIDVRIEAVLDERAPANGGTGWWRVWINGQLVLDRVGATLIGNAGQPHQWFFGIYRYLTLCPSSIPRVMTWQTLRLEHGD